MIPRVQSDLTNIDFEIMEAPSKTYALNMETKRIIKTCDDLNAIIQTAYLILNIERYDYLIYSWNYGIELKDLYGEPMSYVLPELKRRITEALTQDDRILSVDAFSFETNKHDIHITFTIHTKYGQTDLEKVVNI